MRARVRGRGHGRGREGPWRARGRASAVALALAWVLASVLAGAPARLARAAEGGAGVAPPDPVAPATAVRYDGASTALVVVLPPQVDPALEPLRDGMREWLADRMAAAGLDPAPPGLVAKALADLERAGRPLRHGADAPALAARVRASSVLYSDVRFERGHADLRLQLRDAGDGRVLAAGQARAPVAELPGAAQEALAALLSRLGLAASAVAGAPVPTLSEWGALGRARAALEAGALAEAWRELAALEGPAAEQLRRDVDARARDATPAARSRLASAAGRADPDWLRVRDALRGGGDAETLLAAADAAEARGDVDTAVRLYARAVEAAPTRAGAHLAQGRALEAAGRPAEAVDAFRAAAGLAPEDPAPHAALGASAALSARERAEHVLRAGELEAARLDVESATARLDEASRLDPALRGAAQRGTGRLQERLGRHGEAVLAYEQAVAIGGGDPELFVDLGRARASQADRAGAEAAYREALARAPEHAAAHGGLGEVLADAGRVDEALPHLERAVASAPDDAAVRRRLARVLVARGDAEGALAVLDAKALPPRVPAGERAGLLAEAAAVHRGAGDLAGAERALGEAVALEPDDPALRGALADLYEARGDAARAASERALAQQLSGGRPDARGAHARAAAEADEGSPERASEGFATFEALAQSFPVASPLTGRPLRRVVLLGVTEAPDWRVRVRRWLEPRRLDLAAVDLALLEATAARFPVEETPAIPLELVPVADALAALATERDAIAALNSALDTDALFVARLFDDRAPDAPLWAAERPVLEVRLLGGAAPAHVYVLANQLRLDGAAGVYRWNLQAAGPWALLLALVAWPLVRGWGAVVVRLEYDTKRTRGFFHVRLSRRAGKAKASRGKDGHSQLRRYQTRVRNLSRFARAMADSETRFRLVPARTWYVTVHGLLTDAKTNDVIGNYVEERQVRVRRRQEVVVPFNLRPKDAAIEVRLTRAEGGDVTGAGVQGAVVVRGAPETLRYLRGGAAILHVGNGTHRVVIGLGDRVIEQEVEVSNLAATTLLVAVDRDEVARFTGCPEAVDPYLHGDLAAAADALERAGQAAAANLLRAEWHRERGESEQAAHCYAAAGRVQEAAELAASSADAVQSAALFEQAGDYARAAARFRESGDFLRAAAAYEAAFDFDSAIDAYRHAGAEAKALELLERLGRSFEAAELALRIGDGARAIRNFQQVDLRDPGYAESCRMLGALFAERGELELAAEKLGDAVAASGDSDGASLELLEQLGDVLQRAGQTDRALEVFEAVRKRDFGYPGVAERIEALRDLRRTAAAAEATQLSVPAAAGPSESRYELLGEVGRGGMGVVYQARDRRLGRIVALKRLPENLRENPTAVQLFLREARAAAALNHPNIVTLFDADQEDGSYYLTMEFLEGFPLDRILKKRGRLTVRDCVRLGVQIATGLQYAHERHIVHRDIKTSNLFFTKDRVVKIMDFGLAKTMQEVRRAATVIGGTPYYMAPEQATGENVDHRADLYAFGVTLFELATGTVPFTDGDVTWHHRHTPPPDPRTLAPDMPDGYAELVLALMAKDPARRPASAADVGARLAELGRAAG